MLIPKQVLECWQRLHFCERNYRKIDKKRRRGKKTWLCLQVILQNKFACFRPQTNDLNFDTLGNCLQNLISAMNKTFHQFSFKKNVICHSSILFQKLLGK